MTAVPVVRTSHAWQPAGWGLRTVTLAQRPDLAPQITSVLASRWPAFMLAGRPAHGVDLVKLLGAVPQHQVLLVDDRDQVLGTGLSVPVRWDRSVDGLPAGWDGAISNAAELLDAGGTANAVSALSVTMTPAATGRGLAAGMIQALKAAAAAAGSDALMVPVRPVLKAQYPLTPMAKFLTWRTDDDRPFDPWLRLHLRLGALQAGVTYPSVTVTGSVAEWQDWTGLSLPASGEYVIPGGLVPLVVDRRTDSGVYREPNVWVVHRTER
jgi:GNAT superfamily N-acetyltransferase